MNLCAVCGTETDAPEHWGRHVCAECRGRPVLFAASCRTCDWQTATEGDEYARGQAKQTAQREANNHEKTERAIRKNHGHSTEWWEMVHPDRERLLPVKAGENNWESRLSDTKPDAAVEEVAADGK